MPNIMYLTNTPKVSRLIKCVKLILMTILDRNIDLNYSKSDIFQNKLFSTLSVFTNFSSIKVDFTI